METSPILTDSPDPILFIPLKHSLQQWSAGHCSQTVVRPVSCVSEMPEQKLLIYKPNIWRFLLLLFEEELYKNIITQLLVLENFRDDEQLTKYFSSNWQFGSTIYIKIRGLILSSTCQQKLYKVLKFLTSTAGGKNVNDSAWWRWSTLNTL